MPRHEGWKAAGKPRKRYNSGEPPQKMSKQLKARQEAWELLRDQDKAETRKPGSQNPRK